MRAERRHFTAVQKLAILREHLIEKRPISDVCQKHQIQPTLFYLWQKKLFENGAIALEASAAGPGRPNAFRPQDRGPGGQGSAEERGHG